MKWYKFSVVVCVAFLASCASKERAPDTAPTTSSDESAQGSEARGEAVSEEESDRRQLRDKLKDKERVQVGLEDLVTTNNRFAFDLFSLLRADDVVVSPHGVASALGVSYAGADEETARQIATTMRASMGEADVHAKFAQLNGVLRSREDAKTRGARGFRFRSLNTVWHAPQLQPKNRFLRIASRDHVASIEEIDFATKGAKERINRYTSDSVGDKLPEAVTLANVNPLTRVLATNATYFDAPWTVPFDRARTSNAEFVSPSGPTTVAMMRNIGRFAYLDGDGFQLIELPYGDGEVVASVILPDADRADLDSTMTADFFTWMTSQARQTEVDVRLPRFELEGRHELSKTLSSMGMPMAFDPSSANFDRLAREDDETQAYLNDIIHLARLSIDEDGSDAAAASAGSAPSSGSEVPEFYAVRPFLVIVRDLGTGAILMMARVSNPE